MDRRLQILSLFNFLFLVAQSSHYDITARARTVTVTHKTGDGRYHPGRSDEFYFKLFGSKANTAEHLCRANRSRSAVGSCSFEDSAKIGRLQGIRIRNAGNDFWAFVSIEVEIDGTTKGTWDGYRGVYKFKNAFVGFKKVPDEDELGELILERPMQDSPGYCTAGMRMTGVGCQQCGQNTYSGQGATTCTSCPEGMVSAAGSSSEGDCQYEQYPTCDCWTAECGYCSKLDCTVKQDFPDTDDHGIEVQVHSQLTWKKFSSIVLYDQDGKTIGKLQWNIGRLYLTGCIQCWTPPALRKAVVKGGKTSWTFSIKGKEIEIKIGGKSRYKRSLVGECAKAYGKVKRFAFSNADCSNTFTYVSKEMELGDKVTATCSGTCN